MLKLMKDCVRFDPTRQGNGKASGELTIKRGLKRRARRRKLVIDREMKAVLERLIREIRLRVRVHEPAGSWEAARAPG